MRPLIYFLRQLQPLIPHETFRLRFTFSIPKPPSVQVCFVKRSSHARVRYTAFLPQNPGDPYIVHSDYAFFVGSPPNFRYHGNVRRVKSTVTAPRPIRVRVLVKWNVVFRFRVPKHPLACLR